MNRDELKKEIAELITLENPLLYSFFKNYGNEEEKKQIELIENQGGIKKSPAKFSDAYQKWYTKCLLILNLVLPERVQEFIDCYLPDKKRKLIDFGNYCISDAINGLQRPGIQLFPRFAANKLNTQLSIIKSLSSVFDAKLDDIKSLIEFDIYEKQINAAESLLKNGYLRSAGAICGVILEEHLKNIIERHQFQLPHKNNCLNDYNQVLYENKYFDSTKFKFISFLSDIRNKCDHKKENEPSKEEVAKLVDGTNEVISTY